MFLIQMLELIAILREALTLLCLNDSVKILFKLLYKALTQFEINSFLLGNLIIKI
jgi:hypothetical protein